MQCGTGLNKQYFLSDALEAEELNQCFHAISGKYLHHFCGSKMKWFEAVHQMFMKLGVFHLDYPDIVVSQEILFKIGCQSILWVRSKVTVWLVSSDVMTQTLKKKSQGLL